jgi:cysteine desulfurase NifS
MKPIYLDYNATTPIDPRVAAAMLPFIHEHFGNPSSSHFYGMTPRKALEKAREQTAAVLRARPGEIVFTSGGSESNNYAIQGVARAFRNKGNHIITSTVEHPTVTEVCSALEDEGFHTTHVPVDAAGWVDPDAVARAITPQTVLITIMHANNEVGTVNPIREIADIAHRHGIPVHTDAAQSVGKVPVRVDELGVDLLSVAGHKLYAPKGIGALYIREGFQPAKMLHGAGQEGGRRAGTENVILAVGLGEACAMIEENLEGFQTHMEAMRRRLETGVEREFRNIHIQGHRQARLPNTLSVAFKGVKANEILSQLVGVAASAGAACHSDHVAISPVLKAMDVPPEYAMGTIRLSVGRYTTEGEIDRALLEISGVNVLKSLRRERS